MAILRPTRSLLLTGLADVWNAVRDEARRPGERFGLILMVVSAASFAMMAAVAKRLLADVPMQSVVFSRGVMMTLLFVAWARWRRVPLLGHRPGLLVVRGLLGYGALSCYFWSVQHLPLGDAVLLQYSHPLFVALIAPFLLRESAGRWHWPLVIAAFSGVGMIVGATGQLRPAALVGIIGSMLSGLAYLSVRSLSRTEHLLTILVWFPMMTIPGSALATLQAGAAAVPRDMQHVAGHLLVTASALVGQLALTQGLARVRAARATAVTMTGPVFGVLYGWWFFATVPVAASVVGTLVVIVSVVLLARLRHSD